MASTGALTAAAAAAVSTLGVGAAAPPNANVSALNLGVNNSTAIDSALLSAMRDSRERLALLKCERAMVEFCNAPDVLEIDVGGSYNSIIIGLSGTNNSMRSSGEGRQTSFQRCWLHRLADRFSITRESISPEWIRCKKTEHSAIPSNLLIDLKPSDYSINPVDAGEASKGMAKVSIASNGGGNGKIKKRPQKMKIMKRNSSSSLSGHQKDDKKSSSRSANKGSLTEREKSYAEARARIFNDGKTADGGDTDGTAAVRTSSHQNYQQANTISNGNGAVVAAAAQPSPATQEKQFPSWQPQHQRPPAATSNAPTSKVTWRNRQQEENDPDFRRGVVYGTSHLQHLQQHQYQQQQQTPSEQQQQRQTITGYHPQQSYQQQQQYYYDHQYSYATQQQTGATTQASSNHNSQNGSRAGRGGDHSMAYYPDHPVPNTNPTMNKEEFPALG